MNAQNWKAQEFILVRPEDVLKNTESDEVKTLSVGVHPRDDFKLPYEPDLINPYDI